MTVVSPASLCVLVAGAGNIGSPLVELLARDALVRKLCIVDLDCYSDQNVATQSILRSDVGKPKAFVAARRARTISKRRIDVRGYQCDLADIPWDVYRSADLVIAALDSRRARADLAMICWRMGRCLIDTGVHSDSLLARSTVYVPGPNGPCYLCGIDDGKSLEAKYNCKGQTLSAPPTGAPAYLGTAAALLAVSQLHRLARGEGESSSGREIILDTKHQRLTMTNQHRSASCMFDHQIWAVEGSISGRLTLGRALELGSEPCGAQPSALRVEGSAFVTKLACCQPGCGKQSRSLLRLSRRIGAPPVCKCCGASLTASALDLTDCLASSLPARDLRRTLSSLGLRVGDVVTISRAGKDLHFRMGVKNA